MALNSKTLPLKERILEAFIKRDGLVSAFVVLLGFLIATLLIVIIGRNPLGMYSAIIQVLSGWDLIRGTLNVRYIGEWLLTSMPLILCGLSVAFAGRTGLFNIGTEGQYIAGLTVAQLIALYGSPISILHWLLAIFAAIAAGAAWGGIVGFLKARFGVSEVVATIMMNYIALYGSRYVCLQIPGGTTVRTDYYPETARLSNSFFEMITNGSRLNNGLFFVIISILCYWAIMEKTRLGYSLCATGFNRDAARYAGINVNRSMTAAMAISGAFAGLAGAIVALGAYPYGRILTGQDGYGFDGIAVALVGNNNAIGTAVSGLLFGMLKSAQPLMQSRQIPKEIASIIIGLVVVFISLREGVRIIGEWRMKENARKGETTK
jgi:simple sugar transport system permease protein